MRRLSCVVCVLGGLVLAGCHNKPKPAPADDETKAEQSAEGEKSAKSGAAGEGLPPGHPPIDGGSATTQPAAGGLPPGHPPVGSGGPPSMSSGSPGMPAGHPSVSSPGGEGKMAGGTVTQLEGIALKVPEGWQSMPIRPTSRFPNMSPKAVYRLASGKDDSSPVQVRVTHFPRMRKLPNLVQANLERWHGMFTPDTRKADTEQYDLGPYRVTITHVTGTVGPEPEQGMIAAIIEHPEGPHFVAARGPAEAVAKWKPSVLEYIQSVQPTDKGEAEADDSADEEPEPTGSES